ncbi:MAG TPA: metal ABC transporter permease [Phycisphaerae bacterium]|nr:metal ABC transporter permease [Phycisphaerae bacterium]HNU43962.1 metal ABC transporter permease [Phycisphaerae bacterium]
MASVVLLAPDAAVGGTETHPEADRSLRAPATWQLPSVPQVMRVLSLRDYNTRVVVVGTMLLGAGAGIIGTFLLLRKRALMADALSHAALPGIALAFIVLEAAGLSGKSRFGLLSGALVFGAAGVGAVLMIRRWTRVKEDAALAIVLSVFFGLGVALLGVIQRMATGNAAGLEAFIYGKTASMLFSDAVWIGAVAGVVMVVCGMFFKEFTLLCFDQDFAGTQGRSGLLLDTLMLGLAVLITVIGLQAVGLILIVALLVIPPAAARFWTHRLPVMAVIAAGFGALSGLLGASVSALAPRLPAGAIIILVAALLFGVSLLFAPARGFLSTAWQRFRLERKVGQQHVLRALFESGEPLVQQAQGKPGAAAAAGPVPFAALLAQRSWSPATLRRLLAAARRAGLTRRDGDDAYHLTDAGLAAARRAVRNHRLWELYLLTHAEVATSHVDHNADALEDVLDPTLVAQLEETLAAQHPHLAAATGPAGEGPAVAAAVPPSPHRLPGQGAQDVPAGRAGNVSGRR